MNQMNPSQSYRQTLFRVGLFTIAALILIGAVSFFVNDRPYWWRPCQFVRINVEDATGLKEKSPIRSLGLEIGYLKSVDLSETFVTLGICITAPVEVLPTTKAYIRGEGFLGDKFLELKPVKYLEHKIETTSSPGPIYTLYKLLKPVSHWLIASAYAADREIPVGDSGKDVQQLVGRMDKLVKEVTGLTSNLKEAINPSELRETLQQLNKTLDNASKTLSPESGINQTARRTLSKLEDAVEQLRDQVTRINQGQGALGKVLNDPEYAELIKKALINLNRLLNKVADIRFVVDLGFEQILQYDGGRAWFKLAIWPNSERYYLVGVSVDPRGRLSQSTTTTTVGSVSTVVQTQTQEQTGIMLNALIGKVFWRRLDLAVGMIYGDGGATMGLLLGPSENEESIRLQSDLYSRSAGSRLDGRFGLTVKPFYSVDLMKGLYLKVGLESTRTVDGKMPFAFGAGLNFDDDAIKLLFSFI